MNNPMKGPFWAIKEIILTYDGRADSEKWEIKCYPVSIQIKPTPSHKDIWKKVCGEYKYRSWNYFPRGRVEINGKTAVVYANPECYSNPELIPQLIEKYNLEHIDLICKIDNSAHYRTEESQP